MGSPFQSDLFEKPVFESRQPVDRIDVDLFRLRLKAGMSRALKNCAADRHTVTNDMTRILGSDTFSKAMLDAYTSPSKEGHDISVVRMKAFVRATGANDLWDLIVSDEGLIVLEGDEARLAEIARLQQEQKKLSAKLKTLRAIPVEIKRGGG